MALAQLQHERLNLPLSEPIPTWKVVRYEAVKDSKGMVIGITGNPEVLTD
jgi:hypothetical protein